MSSYKILITLILYISTFLTETISCQTDSLKSNVDGSIHNQIYATVSGGVHWGDGRLAAKPIFFAGLGYYFADWFSVKIEYSPVVVKAKNNSESPFSYNGKVLMEGNQITIPEYFIMTDFKIFWNIWFDIGFAPEELFSIKASLKYLLYLNDNIGVQGEYGLLIMGRPGNFKNDTFTNSMLMMGVNYLF